MEYQTQSEFLQLLEIYQALPRRRRVLEIGSMMGDTLREWLRHGDEGMTLISVDKIVPPPDSRHAAQVRAREQWFAEAAGKAELLAIDDYSQKPETIAKVKAALGGGALDFLFIDGGHDYATVKADYENYAPLVRPGGVIAFHDIQGIADVKRLWSEVKKHDEASGREICHPHGWGIGVMEKRDDRPILNIITPCSRPENLPQLAESLGSAPDYFRLVWWVVADGKTDTKSIRQKLNQNPMFRFIQLLVCRAKENVAGKAQINLVLDKIGNRQSATGNAWVWVLDDDNIAHPEFFRELHRILSANPALQGVAFAQLNRQGGVRTVGENTVVECGIDQAQFILRRDLIGDERYLIKYTADGEFAERLYKKNPAAWWLFCNEPLTYYNWLKP
ncbi:MAG: class I SAM-dependent methyltransferase [Patescibacteria group bacterium]|nr:class I SAM-dependent methyltransferase [Patescibacteria group bacterium]